MNELCSVELLSDNLVRVRCRAEGPDGVLGDAEFEFTPEDEKQWAWAQDLLKKQNSK